MVLANELLRGAKKNLVVSHKRKDYMVNLHSYLLEKPDEGGLYIWSTSPQDKL